MASSLYGHITFQFQSVPPPLQLVSRDVRTIGPVSKRRMQRNARNTRLCFYWNSTACVIMLSRTADPPNSRPARHERFCRFTNGTVASTADRNIRIPHICAMNRNSALSIVRRVADSIQSAKSLHDLYESGIGLYYASRDKYCKGAITSKIKHATKHKNKSCKTCTTAAQLLQPSLAFCFSLQPITAYRQVLDGTPLLAAN